MTVEELYKWAIQEGVEDYTIVVRDSFGSTTMYVEPTIDNSAQEVEL